MNSIQNHIKSILKTANSISTDIKKLIQTINSHKNGKWGFFLERDGETFTRIDLSQIKKYDESTYIKEKIEFNNAIMNENKPEEGIR